MTPPGVNTCYNFKMKKWQFYFHKYSTLTTGMWLYVQEIWCSERNWPFYSLKRLYQMFALSLWQTNFKGGNCPVWFVYFPDQFVFVGQYLKSIIFRHMCLSWGFPEMYLFSTYMYLFFVWIPISFPEPPGVSTWVHLVLTLATISKWRSDS